LEDPNFKSTVLLLSTYDEEGAFGVILNRVLNIDVNTLFEQLPITLPNIPPQPTLFGGPVEMTSCMTLYEGELSVDAGFSIIDEEQNHISLSPSLKELERLIEQGISFEFILGSAGWGPGQLDQEIHDGSWLYTDISPLLLLSIPPSERYSFAIGRYHLRNRKK
jgi:putative transcriptional regulator